MDKNPLAIRNYLKRLPRITTAAVLFTFIPIVTNAIKVFSPKMRNLMEAVYALTISISLPIIGIGLIYLDYTIWKRNIKNELKTKVVCAKCGYFNDSRCSFCVNCGNALLYKCSMCSAFMNTCLKYCVNCGIKLKKNG